MNTDQEITIDLYQKQLGEYNEKLKMESNPNELIIIRYIIGHIETQIALLKLGVIDDSTKMMC